MKKAIVCIIIFLMVMSLCACTDSVREDTGGDTDIGGLFWDILHGVRGDEEQDNANTEIIWAYGDREDIPANGD